MLRRIDLEGCLNFRDLGGYATTDGRRVRWRTVFRSDALGHLTPGDVARMRDELGIKDVVDLRSTAERRADVTAPLAREPIQVHHVALFDGETRETREARARRTASEERLMTLADRYVALAELAGDRIARAVTILAESDGGCVVHCAAGKDRTGVVSAIVLGALGVGPEDLAEDYGATRENLDRIVQRLRSTEGYDTMLGALPPETMHADPETMADLLRRLDERFGSVREYLRSVGVAGDTLARLEARLLE
ncbi:MAG: tyrosine-protein phosphatase [Deltaproteobacteria bacterium]|nr:tyrosine-protein phosphatase [Deltaproteobacteria bacterium]